VVHQQRNNKLNSLGTEELLTDQLCSCTQ